MAEDNHNRPLAPAWIYPRSDQLVSVPDKSQFPPPPRRRQAGGVSKCFAHSLLFLVLLAIAVLTFAMIVCRVDAPSFRLEDPAVEDLQYATSPAASINATLTANLTVTNNNFGRYDYGNRTSVVVLYLGHPFGDSTAIGAGHCRARYTDSVNNVIIRVRSSWLWSDVVRTNLSQSLSSRMVRFTTYAKFRGTVRVLGIARQRTSDMNCTVNLNLASRMVQNLSCI